MTTDLLIFSQDNWLTVAPVVTSCWHNTCSSGDQLLTQTVAPVVTSYCSSGDQLLTQTVAPMVTSCWHGLLLQWWPAVAPVVTSCWHGLLLQWWPAVDMYLLQWWPTVDTDCCRRQKRTTWTQRWCPFCRSMWRSPRETSWSSWPDRKRLKQPMKCCWWVDGNCGLLWDWVLLWCWGEGEGWWWCWREGGRVTNCPWMALK